MLGISNYFSFASRHTRAQIEHISTSFFSLEFGEFLTFGGSNVAVGNPTKKKINLKSTFSRQTRFYRDQRRQCSPVYISHITCKFNFISGESAADDSDHHNDFNDFEENNAIAKANLRFVLKTLDRYDIKDTYIPIREPEKLLTIGEYKQNQSLVIFISGFTTNLRKERSPSHDTLAEVYVRFRPEVNFMVGLVFKPIT